ncbi:hypothetical protein G0U57_002477 [Chelydra serpentina]|uniref:Uncharacterized protein n=1 Tax=Chelydra serpentina TaxID=8475 RepID=A0A8T1TEN9_CHESE|nr:hypothetical protein G0U57_002477 [Chelydra serpentina]
MPWTALHQTVKMDAEDDGYVEFRGRLGTGLTEPVPRREHKKGMRSIVRVAVCAVFSHCLREKLFEDCEGCVIDAPAQWHHDSVTWTSEDINCKLRDELSLESLLNTVIAIGYAMECLCLTQEHLYEMFDLQKELAYYCQLDVQILRWACILYRGEIMKMTKMGDVVERGPGKFIEVTLCIDPFRYITLASVCMAMYRFMFLQPNTVALLPPDNYHRQKEICDPLYSVVVVYCSQRKYIDTACFMGWGITGRPLLSSQLHHH